MSQFLCAQRADSPVARGAPGAQCAWRAPRRRARRRGGGLRRALAKEASTAPSTTGARAAFFWTTPRETKRKFFAPPRPPNFNVQRCAQRGLRARRGKIGAATWGTNIEIGGAGAPTRRIKNLRLVSRRDVGPHIFRGGLTAPASSLATATAPASSAGGRRPPTATATATTTTTTTTTTSAAPTATATARQRRRRERRRRRASGAPSLKAEEVVYSLTNPVRRDLPRTHARAEHGAQEAGSI